LRVFQEYLRPVFKNFEIDDSQQALVIITSSLQHYRSHIQDALENLESICTDVPQSSDYNSEVLLENFQNPFLDTPENSSTYFHRYFWKISKNHSKVVQKKQQELF
jgi:hypothetical protein